jgi:TrpR family trp operon transcriptional repressor
MVIRYTPTMDKENEYVADLIDHLLSLSSPSALENSLRELLTPAEFTEVTKRLQIIRMLEAGVPQRQIAETLGVGIATVTRGSKILSARQDGEGES